MVSHRILHIISLPLQQLIMQTTDQTGRPVLLKNFPPQRIVSLVPSQTELLYYLGLDTRILGTTLFCIHPEAVKNSVRVGGTKKLHLEKIRALQPDLIIANKEENVKDQVETLAADFPVWVSDIHTVEDALQMIQAVGDLTGTSEAASKLSLEIREKFAPLHRISHQERTIRVAYLIWNDPWMAVAGDNFIHSMLEICGLENVFSGKTNLSRYPEISPGELIAAKPDVVMLSSEPYPFREKHAEAIRKMLPETIVSFVDGEMFSWYGNRMLDAADYFLNWKQNIFAALEK